MHLNLWLSDVEFKRGEQLKSKAISPKTAGDDINVLIVKSGAITVAIGSDILKVSSGQSLFTKGNLRQLDIVASTHSACIKLISFDIEILFSLNLSEILLLSIQFKFLKNCNSYFFSGDSNILKASDLLEAVLENNFDNHMKDDSLHCVLKMIIYESIGYLQAETPRISSGRQSRLYIDFYNMLRKNYRREHGVSFYAEQLCVTPRHLSSVIKSQTGKTAKGFIELFIMQDARRLLDKNKLSIGQIADQLNFIDQVQFGKYFKRVTGFSPRNFRNYQISQRHRESSKANC